MIAHSGLLATATIVLSWSPLVQGFLPIAPSSLTKMPPQFHTTCHDDNFVFPTALFGKKAARKGTGGGSSSGGNKPRGQQPTQEKQSVIDQRFDAATRQFMFTMVGLTKMLPDKSKTILKNIHLSFFPGAKIGVVGLNGSGKSTLLKIMAGIDTEFDGLARPLPGASIGYLSQEPQLEFETVQECVDDAVKSSQAILDEYNEQSLKLADPTLDDQQMAVVMTRMEKLNDQIEAGNLWDLERVVSRAMDALRVPSGDAKTAVLSGGEKRRVALCRLLLSNHDMYVEITVMWILPTIMLTG
jgi:energy-dependent translational throttle protein EttA